MTTKNLTPDECGVEGAFVDIVSGEHAGRRGSYEQTVTTDKAGNPKTVLVRTRDARSELLTVNYADVRPAPPEYVGGR